MAVTRTISRAVSGSPAYTPDNLPVYRGGAAAGGGAFTPASLYGPGDVGDYWDSYDLSTLFQDAAGTTPVVSAGDPIGRWEGLRGLVNRIQNSTANKPPYSADGRVNLNRSGVAKYLVGAEALELICSGDYFIGVQMTCGPGQFQWVLSRSGGYTYDFHPGTSGSYFASDSTPTSITNVTSGVDTTCFVQASAIDGYASIGGVVTTIAMAGPAAPGTTETIYPDAFGSDIYVSRMIAIGRPLTGPEIVNVAAWLAEVP